MKGKKLIVVDKVIDVVNELQMWDQITLSSFYHPYHDHIEVVLRNIKLEQRIYFGFLAQKLEQIPTYTERNYKENDSLNLDIQLLTKHKDIMLEHIKRAKEKKQRIKFYFPFSVAEDEKIYEEMLNYEADTIITNHPVKLIEYLKRKSSEKGAYNSFLTEKNSQELIIDAIILANNDYLKIDIDENKINSEVLKKLQPNVKSQIF